MTRAPKISNVWVNRESSYLGGEQRYSVGGRDEKDRRYHCWIYRLQGRLVVNDGAIFFNPSSEASGFGAHGLRKPGYFATRTLDINEARGKAVLQQLMQQADEQQLFKQADDLAKSKHDEQQARNAEAYAKRLKEHAGPDLYDALMKAAAILELGNAAPLVDINDALAVAKAALLKAVTPLKNDADLT